MEKSRDGSSGRHSKRATRRGPMDEMRQLVRILVKVIPQSSKNIRSCDEGGGGNRISEDQIKHYLSSTLGDAPQPKWGVPEGWSTYLAELFTWVTGRNIRQDQAAMCAKREPGRSWEAIESELANLGILPSTWPLPLSKESMGNALIPAAQLQSNSSTSAQRSGSAKRSLDESSGLMLSNGKRSRSETLVNSPYTGITEAEAWQQALNAVNLALSKAGSTDSLEQQMTIARLKAEIQSKVQVPSIVPQPPMLLGSQAPQLVPISVPGQNGQSQTAYTLQMPLPSQLPLAPANSLDLGSFPGLANQQPLRSTTGGSSAFQAVRPSSTDPGSGLNCPLLSNPPPLRILRKGSIPCLDSDSDSPSSDEGNSSTFTSNYLTWTASVSGPMNNLFKPTALKKEAQGPSPSQSQDEAPKTASKQSEESRKVSCTAFESLQNAAKLLSMGRTSPQFCSQLHEALQSQCKPIFVGQQYGKSY